MSKQLVLKPRAIKDQKPTWHDVFVVNNALEEMAKGKTLSKMSVFLSVAGKIELCKEEIDLQSDLNQDVVVHLRNSESRIFWREIDKLKPEQYGRNKEGAPAAPPLGLLYLMLSDIADQLGEKMPEPDDDDLDG